MDQKPDTPKANGEDRHVRDPDIEEFSNRIFIHPISDRLAPLLVPTGIHPNLVSLGGLSAGLIAALFYSHPEWAYSAWAGFGFMILWHILDGTDGQLARLSGKSSAIGKVVDGLADYSVFGAVYIVLAWMGSESMGLNAWLIGFAAAFSHALQSASYERQREKFTAWTKPASAPATTGQDQADAHAPAGRIARLLDGLYTRVQALLDRDKESRALLDQVLFLPAQTQAEVRAEYRARFAAQVQLWSLLSANIHTLAIFLFALFGNAWDYFLFELIGLNLLLIVLSAHQASADRNFLNWLRAVIQAEEREK